MLACVKLQEIYENITTKEEGNIIRCTTHFIVQSFAHVNGCREIDGK